MSDKSLQLCVVRPILGIAICSLGKSARSGDHPAPLLTGVAVAGGSKLEAVAAMLDRPDARTRRGDRRHRGCGFDFVLR